MEVLMPVRLLHYENVFKLMEYIGNNNIAENMCEMSTLK